LGENDFEFFFDNRVRMNYNRIFEDVGLENHTSGLDRIGVRESEANYRYFRHKDFDNVKIETTTEDIRETFSYDKGFGKRVLVIGTSHIENITHEMLAFTFGNVRKVRVNCCGRGGARPQGKSFSVKFWEGEIKKFKPDIIVLLQGNNSSDDLEKMDRE
jgi:hypothetical protein